MQSPESHYLQSKTITVRFLEEPPGLALGHVCEPGWLRESDTVVKDRYNNVLDISTREHEDICQL